MEDPQLIPARQRLHRDDQSLTARGDAQRLIPDKAVGALAQQLLFSSPLPAPGRRSIRETQVWPGWPGWVSSVSAAGPRGGRTGSAAQRAAPTRTATASYQAPSSSYNSGRLTRASSPHRLLAVRRSANYIALAGVVKHKLGQRRRPSQPQPISSRPRHCRRIDARKHCDRPLLHELAVARSKLGRNAVGWVRKSAARAFCTGGAGSARTRRNASPS